MMMKTMGLIFILGVVVIATVFVYFYKNDDKNYKKDNDNDDNYIRDYQEKNFLEKNFSEKNFIPQEEKEEHKNITILSEGNQIACESLKEVTGNDVEKNYEFKIKNGNLRVDCFDKNTNIAVDYKSENNYEYKNDDKSMSLLNFYDLHYKNTVKEDILNKNKITYLKIPYVVDRCYPIEDNNYNCEQHITKGIRQTRITNYLKEVLVSI
jgi:hypothetical protein